MWGLMKFIAIVQARPSDVTIRILRVLFWLIILSAIYFEFSKYNLAYPEFILSNYQEVLDKYSDYIKVWVLWIFGLVPIFMWITWICFLKKKKMRILQIIFWVILMISSFYIISENNLDKNSNNNPDSNITKENIKQDEQAINKDKDEIKKTVSSEITFDDIVNWSTTNISVNTKEEILSSYITFLPTLLFWLAFLPLFAWITWKCILKKCLKHWEKIVTIRV